MNSSAQCERVNRTVFEARDFEVLNVTLGTQKALIWDRAIEPRVEGLSINLKRRRRQTVTVWLGHVSRDWEYSSNRHFSRSENVTTPIQVTSAVRSDGDQAQEDMEANQRDQEEVEAQMEDAHGGQSPPQRITRSMFKALGARGHLFSLFVISLVEGA